MRACSRFSTRSEVLGELRRARQGAVPGVERGLFGGQLGVLDASALVRLMPGQRDSREGGSRDALESMALALLAEGVSLQTINSATETAMDAYSSAP